MSNFRPIDRQTGFLLPPSVDEWLPEKHLARFVVEVIDGLDLRVMRGSYRGSGSASYHPSLLLGILVYGYATGVFSSRKLERATYDSVAFRFIARATGTVGGGLGCGREWGWLDIIGGHRRIPAGEQVVEGAVKGARSSLQEPMSTFLRPL